MKTSIALAIDLGVGARARADEWSEPARYRIEYRVDLPALAVQPGQSVRVWVPYPATTPDQTVEPGGEIDAP